MKRYEDQVCLKLSGTLRAAIEADAAERSRSISWIIRRLLIEHYSQRGVDRTEKAA